MPVVDDKMTLTALDGSSSASVKVEGKAAKSLVFEDGAINEILFEDGWKIGFDTKCGSRYCSVPLSFHPFRDTAVIVPWMLKWANVQAVRAKCASVDIDSKVSLANSALSASCFPVFRNIGFQRVLPVVGFCRNGTQIDVHERVGVLGNASMSH